GEVPCREEVRPSGRKAGEAQAGEDHVSLAARDVSAKAPNSEPFQPRSANPPSQANVLAHRLTSPQVRIVRPSVRWPNPHVWPSDRLSKEIRGFFTWPWSIWPSEV